MQIVQRGKRDRGVNQVQSRIELVRDLKRGGIRLCGQLGEVGGDRYLLDLHDACLRSYGTSIENAGGIEIALDTDVRRSLSGPRNKM